MQLGTGDDDATADDAWTDEVAPKTTEPDFRDHTGDGSLLGAPQGGNAGEKFPATLDVNFWRTRKVRQMHILHGKICLASCVSTRFAYGLATKNFWSKTLEMKNFNGASISVEVASISVEVDSHQKVSSAQPSDGSKPGVSSAHAPQSSQDPLGQGENTRFYKCMTSRRREKSGKWQKEDPDGQARTQAAEEARRAEPRMMSNGCRLEQVVDSIAYAKPDKPGADRGSTTVVADELGSVVDTNLEAGDSNARLNSNGLEEFGGKLYGAAFGTSLFEEAQWREAVRALNRQLGARFGTTVGLENATEQDEGNQAKTQKAEKPKGQSLLDAGPWTQENLRLRPWRPPPGLAKPGREGHKGPGKSKDMQPEEPVQGRKKTEGEKPCQVINGRENAMKSQKENPRDRESAEAIFLICKLRGASSGRDTKEVAVQVGSFTGAGRHTGACPLTGGPCGVGVPSGFPYQQPSLQQQVPVKTTWKPEAETQRQSQQQQTQQQAAASMREFGKGEDDNRGATGQPTTAGAVQTGRHRRRCWFACGGMSIDR